MPPANKEPTTGPPAAVERVAEPWPVLKVPVPPEWKRWLQDAADARAIPVAALVRLCIRALMIQRHEGGT
jgi:hypothetical protein